jgi:hypothetical protein
MMLSGRYVAAGYLMNEHRLIERMIIVMKPNLGHIKVLQNAIKTLEQVLKNISKMIL